MKTPEGMFLFNRITKQHARKLRDFIKGQIYAGADYDALENRIIDWLGKNYPGYRFDEYVNAAQRILFKYYPNRKFSPDVAKRYFRNALNSGGEQRLENAVRTYHTQVTKTMNLTPEGLRSLYNQLVKIAEDELSQWRRRQVGRGGAGAPVMITPGGGAGPALPQLQPTPQPQQTPAPPVTPLPVTPTPGPGPTGRTGILEGYVYGERLISRKKGKTRKIPLPGATVSMLGSGGSSTTTGPDGSFSLPNLPIGEHQFLASAQGYRKSDPVDKKIELNRVSFHRFLLQDVQIRSKEDQERLEKATAGRPKGPDFLGSGAKWSRFRGAHHLKKEEMREDHYNTELGKLNKRIAHQRERYLAKEITKDEYNEQLRRFNDAKKRLKGVSFASEDDLDSYRADVAAIEQRFKQNIAAGMDTMDASRIRKDETDQLQRGLYGGSGGNRRLRSMGRGLRWLGERGKPAADAKTRGFKRLATSSVMLAAFVIAGAFTYGFSIWFFWGFLSLGFYFLWPGHKDWGEISTPLNLSNMNPFTLAPGERVVGWSYLKSITKVAAIICFAIAFSELGDVFNIAFIAVALLGYIWLPVQYDPKYPGQFLESLLRFGVLGAYFIPFWIFGSIFQSYVLTAIAFAFFAIPPMPSTGEKNIVEVLSRGLSGASAYYEAFDKIIFAGLMIFALVGALTPFPGWELKGTLKFTFIYFWIVAGIGGFFSPANTRPMTGILMLGGATVIYGVGPGSQEVGAALFGQWWPTIHNSVQTISEPISSVFSQIGTTITDGVLLVTNPVGYTTRILNGTYAENPNGRTGAFGVEVNRFDITPIYIKTPFIVTVTVKNEGASEAKSAKVKLDMGDAPPVRVPERQGGAPNPIDFFRPGAQTLQPVWTLPRLMTIQDMAFTKTTEELGTLAKQESRAFFFESTGVDCRTIHNYNLRDKFIPLKATVEYAYSVDSNLEVSFMSTEEWERLATANKLFPRQIRSTIQTSPVKLNLGTLDQPIREGTPFFIGINLASAEGPKSEIRKANITLKYPAEAFGLPTDCSRKPTDTKPGMVSFNFATDEPVTPVYCNFIGMSKDKLGEKATETFFVEAAADFQFASWDTKDTNIEFRGECPAESFVPPTEELYFGTESYCAVKKQNRGLLCGYGEGGCSSDVECTSIQETTGTVAPVGFERETKLSCKDATGLPVKVCCKPTDTSDQCRLAYDKVAGKLGLAIPPFSPTITRGATDYCSQKIKLFTDAGIPDQAICNLAEGSCTGNDQCDTTPPFEVNPKSATGEPLVCKTLPSRGNIGVCCFKDWTEQECANALDVFISGAPPKVIPPVVVVPPVVAPPTVPPPVGYPVPVEPQYQSLAGTNVPLNFQSTILEMSFKWPVKLDPALIAAITMQESAMGQRLESPTGAYGVMQVICSSGAKDVTPGYVSRDYYSKLPQFNVANRDTCKANLKDTRTGFLYGTAYLSKLLDKNYYDLDREDIWLAVAAYNCGPTAMRNLASKYGYKWDDVKPHILTSTCPRPSETLEYVGRIQAYYNYYFKYYHKSLPQVA
ncbi:MAG: transglycosylase SLT domain-containing protein [Candidatus Aenigmarchaeota archaeon]|nr:transglycosylase SLT domain-containing protein [Candidatus Aenigmarchaeota archaeon]